MKTSILALVSALSGGVSSQVVNHPNPTHDLLSKKSRMKAFGPATVVHGREQYSRSVQSEAPCADTVGWVDSSGDGCDWDVVNNKLSCPTYGQYLDGGMGVSADNYCYCAGTGEDDTTAATTTTSSTLTLAPEVDNPCIICPNGATDGFDDFKPFVDIRDDVGTCAELIQVSTTIEIVTPNCALI